ncbi:substrate-binding protein [Halorientalis salina]|uniref:substrate-binding protein n=1 Tax=Halorientalis salina TaxID=2932266 RepID=UPI0010AD5F58|nr:substrate-binding protein [Halorientalis salina]
MSDTYINRRRVLQATGGLTVTGLAGCLGASGSETLTIGANLPLSEGWEPYGNTQVRAAEIAISEINDNGGLDGKDVELVVEDNQVDPQTSRDMADRLVSNEGANVLMGPISSANRVAVSSALERLQVPSLYASQYEGPAADDYCSEWMFQLGDIPSQKIEPFVPWLIEEHGDSFYLLGDDYSWPKQTNEAVKQAVDDGGGEIIGEEYVSLDTTDFSSIIPRIEQEDPDVLFMTITGGGPAAMQSQMQEQGIRDQFAQVGLAHGQGVLQGASPEATEGVYSCHAYLEGIENDSNTEFISKYRDKHGDDALVNYFTGPAYNAIKLLEDAVDRSGGSSPEDIKQGLQGASTNSIMGETIIESDNQMTVGTFLGQVNSDQKYDIVKSFDPVSPTGDCDDI